MFKKASITKERQNDNGILNLPDIIKATEKNALAQLNRHRGGTKRKRYVMKDKKECYIL
jgi:hypothetical protein